MIPCAVNNGQVPADASAPPTVGEAMPDPPRAYHHGRLAEALVDAATEMARVGGPDAVILREAARRVGVSPTAAYRHFDGQTALLAEVKYRALAVLAERLAAARDAVPQVSPALEFARHRLVACGQAYVEFALTEKGLFECFSLGLPIGPAGTTKWSVDDIAETSAFSVLTGLMDELAAAGGVDPSRRPAVDFAAWAAVHGLAVLCLDGILAKLPGLGETTLIDAVADVLFYGLLPR